jgi:hypothetical protein
VNCPKCGKLLILDREFGTTSPYPKVERQIENTFYPRMDGFGREDMRIRTTITTRCECSTIVQVTEVSEYALVK